MSKRRHKNRVESRREMSNNSNNNNSNNNNNMNGRQQYNSPFGINPSQLLSMFGNIDMNQINSMLQSMNTQGFDFNNLNLGNLQNFMGGSVRGNQSQNINQEQASESRNENNIKSENTNNMNNINNINREDENIQMLMAIRSIVGGERASFIDKVITLYKDGAFD